MGIPQNVIRSSHDHFAPSVKISCKSVQPFSRNDDDADDADDDDDDDDERICFNVA